MSVYPFIEAERAAGSRVVKACVLLEVSRAAYYHWRRQVPSLRQRDDAELGQRIAAIHEGSRGTYGAPRVHQQLHREGVACGKKRVARLMSERGLAGRCRRRFKRTTVADPAANPQTPDLVRRAFGPEGLEPNQVWVGDISYLRTWEGWCYIATVIDLASRRVVGFAIADHMRASLVSDALRMAATARRPSPGLVFHTDRGSQYTAQEFRRLLTSYAITQSLSRPGQCWDNAVAESFFATLKTELISRHAWPTRAAVRAAVFEFIEVFYNRQRLHSALGYRSPAEYETLQSTAAPAA